MIDQRKLQRLFQENQAAINLRSQEYHAVINLRSQEYHATLYGPNEDSPTFFKNINKLISDLHNTTVIMVGDWNVVQDFNLDTVNYKSKNNPKAQEVILELKQSLDLVAIWRENNPNVKRFTLRGPNSKQSRLDYFLISSDLEPFVKKQILI